MAQAELFKVSPLVLSSEMGQLSVSARPSPVSHAQGGSFAFVSGNLPGNCQSRSETSLGGPSAGQDGGPEQRGEAVSV